MPSKEAWVESTKVLLRHRDKAQLQVLKVGLQNCLIKVVEIVFENEHLQSI
jgi:hypothetical protein